MNQFNTALKILLFASIALAFQPSARCAPVDKESAPLNIRNLLECRDLEPYVSLNVPDHVKTRRDPLVVEHQFLGSMVTIEPGEAVSGLSYYQAVVMLVKSYDEPMLVFQQYLDELHSYLLEQEFERHSFSGVVLADSSGGFFALPGMGYLVSGIVSADTAVQGMPFSEEFINFVLPGNVNLRVIFKYPTASQNNKLMRKDMESILTSLIVHTDNFNLAGDTSLRMLKKN